MPEKEDHRMALIQALKNKKPASDPAEVARNDFRNLLRLSLDSLLAAGNMALDRRIPDCLSTFAQEITRVDEGVPFRPRLRKMVSACLENEMLAIEYMDYLKANKSEVDPYVHRLLLPLLETLVSRDKVCSITNRNLEKPNGA